jgi:hypothetical protein
MNFPLSTRGSKFSADCGVIAFLARRPWAVDTTILTGAQHSGSSSTIFCRSQSKCKFEGNKPINLSPSRRRRRVRPHHESEVGFLLVKDQNKSRRKSSDNLSCMMKSSARWDRQFTFVPPRLSEFFSPRPRPHRRVSNDVRLLISSSRTPPKARL